jgi:hypothetical protein
MNKNLFILTSALNTKFGAHTNEQRLAQTLNSIASIKHHAPNSDILIVEMGGIPPTDEQIDTIESRVEYYYNYSQDENVQGIFHSTDNWDIVKNTTEVMVFGNLLQDLINEKDIKKYDRIFKMSGRYVLTEKFNINYYETVPKNIVVLQRRASQFPPAVTGNRHFQYMSRLWSWPASDTDTVLTAYQTGFNAMAQCISEGGYFDIEHMLFDFLPANLIVETQQVGLQGLLGPNGSQVDE